MVVVGLLPDRDVVGILTGSLAAVRLLTEGGYLPAVVPIQGMGDGKVLRLAALPLHDDTAGGAKSGTWCHNLLG